MGIIDGILAVCFSLTLFGIAIYETWVVDTNGGAKSDCWQVWINILVVCVINWFFGLITLCTLCAGMADDNDGKLFGPAGVGAIVGISFVQILYHIWTMVINENIDDNCIDKYKEQYYIDTSVVVLIKIRN